MTLHDEEPFFIPNAYGFTAIKIYVKI
jgi:hypothetical protein